MSKSQLSVLSGLCYLTKHQARVLSLHSLFFNLKLRKFVNKTILKYILLNPLIDLKMLKEIAYLCCKKIIHNYLTYSSCLNQNLFTHNKISRIIKAI